MVSVAMLMTYQSMSPVVSIAAVAVSPSAAWVAVAAELFGSVSVILAAADGEIRWSSGAPYINSGCENRAAVR